MIIFLGSSGKVGKLIFPKIKDHFQEAKIVKVESDKVMQLSNILNNERGKSQIIILSIYSKNIFRTIRTYYRLLSINFSDLYIIELNSILQLSNPIETINFPKYLSYYLNRRLQSIILISLCKFFKIKGLDRIFFGALSEYNNCKFASIIESKVLAKTVIENIKKKTEKSVRFENMKFLQIIKSENPICENKKSIYYLLDKILLRKFLLK